VLAKNAPVVAAEQNAHTPPRTAPGPSRDRAAANAALTACTSSPRPVAPGGGRAGGNPSSTAKPTNRPRSTSARPRSRRSHERTVVSLRPSATAIPRYPRPSEAIPSAHPITSTASIRRARRNPGNSACVRAHALQRARLTSSLNIARPTRTLRRYPPHEPSSPAHSGQRIRASSDGPTPTRNIGPTHFRGTATISTGASQRAPPISRKTGALFHVQQAKSRRPAAPTSKPRALPAFCV
jgi:hypothetical protein